MNIFPFHPCKKCIVRPTCNKDCEKFDKYEANYIYYSSAFIGTILIFIIGILSFFISKWIIISYFILFYIYFIHKVIKEFTDFEELERHDKLFAILFGSILFPGSSIIYKIDDIYNLTNYINKYRHF